MDWQSAMKHCRSMNTDLVIIANHREQAALARVLSSKKRKFFSTEL